MRNNDPMANERYRYQMGLRRKPVSMQLWGVAKGESEGARGGFLMAGQEYSGEDCVAVMSWLTERAAGYPINSMLWGIGRWPFMSDDERAMRWLDDQIQAAVLHAIMSGNNPNWVRPGAPRRRV